MTEYPPTANLGARAIPHDDHGVAPADVAGVQGGIDEPGRPGKIAVKLRPSIRAETVPEGDTLSATFDVSKLSPASG